MMEFELIAIELESVEGTNKSFKITLKLSAAKSGARSGLLTLSYPYLPLVEVGSKYSIEEILGI